MDRLPAKTKKEQEESLLVLDLENLTEDQKPKLKAFYKSHMKNCSSCPKSLPIDCLEERKKARKIIEEGRLQEEWKRNEELRPCLAAEMLEKLEGRKK